MLDACEVRLTGFGGTEVLRIEEDEMPRPGPGEVLIRVAAAGVNRADLHQRQGHYPPPPGASDILGLEVAGKTVERGTGTDERWKIDDKVCALVPGGGYAEYCIAHEGCCLAHSRENGIHGRSIVARGCIHCMGKPLRAATSPFRRSAPDAGRDQRHRDLCNPNGQGLWCSCRSDGWFG